MKKSLGNVVSMVYENKNIKSAIKYLRPDFRIKATARFSDHKEIIVNIGKPNFKERKFVKECLAAGEPFPIKKIQTV